MVYLEKSSYPGSVCFIYFVLSKISKNYLINVFSIGYYEIIYPSFNLVQ